MFDFLRGFIGASIGRMLAAELYAWIPVVSVWLLKQYIRWLPEGVGSRLLEEWQADHDLMPGNLAKLSFSCNIGLQLIRTRGAARWFEKHQRKAKSKKSKDSSQSQNSRIFLSESLEKLERLTAIEEARKESLFLKEALALEKAFEEEVEILNSIHQVQPLHLRTLVRKIYCSLVGDASTPAEKEKLRQVIDRSPFVGKQENAKEEKC